MVWTGAPRQPLRVGHVDWGAGRGLSVEELPGPPLPRCPPAVRGASAPEVPLLVVWGQGAAVPPWFSRGPVLGGDGLTHNWRQRARAADQGSAESAALRQTRVWRRSGLADQATCSAGDGSWGRWGTTALAGRRPPAVLLHLRADQGPRPTQAPDEASCPLGLVRRC